MQGLPGERTRLPKRHRSWRFTSDLDSMETEMTPCRECLQPISEQATACPHCGAPFPARADWDGWGYEFKSRTEVLGMPFLHISFKYRPNRTPVVAKGFIAIGQFGVGVFNLSQFGIGVFSLSQFTIAGYAVAQFALAYSAIAQFGVYIDRGYGQMVYRLAELFGG
jgi:hypothetical protein